MTDKGLSRRSALEVGGIGVLGVSILTLAGCGSSSPKTSSGVASTSPNESGSVPASPGGAAPLVELSQVPVGGSVAAKLDGKPIVVSQQTVGKVTAFSAICTHMGCTVNAAGPQLQCPCHGSTYNSFTGQVERGPAPAPLTAIPVKVQDGSVVRG